MLRALINASISLIGRYELLNFESGPRINIFFIISGGFMEMTKLCGKIFSVKEI